MPMTYLALTLLSTFVCALFLVGCAGTPPTHAQIVRQPFGRTSEGEAVDVFTLRNANGVEARICNYGGIVVSFKAPDRHGKMEDIVLGYDQLEGYLTNNSPYFGCLVGRYGNRIAGGKFTLEGKEYKLATNNGPNALHGGLKGFNAVVWEPSIRTSPDGPSLQLKYLSKDGEEGYPGNLSVTAVYTVTEDNGLRLDYTATTDKPTVVNLTQHSYFNLAPGNNVLNHRVMIAADKFTPTDSTLIPTGELRPVDGTPFDFRQPTAIGARINEDNEQLKFGSGYDQNWVLNKPANELGLAARVVEPKTGRVLEVLTTEPAMQFYTANHLKHIIGKGGRHYLPHDAFCMEPQHFPDSPNHPEFPSTTLKPGEVYRNTIIYRVSVTKGES